MFKLIFIPTSQLHSQQFIITVSNSEVSPQFKGWGWNSRYGYWEITKPSTRHYEHIEIWEWLENCNLVCQALCLQDDIAGNFEIVPSN